MFADVDRPQGGEWRACDLEGSCDVSKAVIVRYL